MIGSGQPSFFWTRQSIVTSAPNSSGVYVLFTPQAWIYVGESGDVQARLLQHLNGDNPCITRNAPTGFQFEVVAGQSQRVARQDQLILAFGPACNQRLG
jgi:excinuclease UvrABC nuclease subunit